MFIEEASVFSWRVSEKCLAPYLLNLLPDKNQWEEVLFPPWMSLVLKTPWNSRTEMGGVSSEHRAEDALIMLSFLIWPGWVHRKLLFCLFWWCGLYSATRKCSYALDCLFSHSNLSPAPTGIKNHLVPTTEMATDVTSIFCWVEDKVNRRESVNY